MTTDIPPATNVFRTIFMCNSFYLVSKTCSATVYEMHVHHDTILMPKTTCAVRECTHNHSHPIMQSENTAQREDSTTPVEGSVHPQ